MEPRMFDYKNWSDWLEKETETARALGFSARFNRAKGPGDQRASFGAACETVAGAFAVWDTGQAGYNINDVNGRPITFKWGLQVTDETFRDVFAEFSQLLQKCRVPWGDTPAKLEGLGAQTGFF
jgi:hypothetical protein